MLLNPSFTYSNPGTMRKEKKGNQDGIPEIKLSRASRTSVSRKDPKIMKIFRNSKRESSYPVDRPISSLDPKIDNLKVPEKNEIGKNSARKTRSLSKEQQFLLMEKMKKKKVERESRTFGNKIITEKKHQKKLVITFQKEKDIRESTKKSTPILSKSIMPTLYLRRLQKNLKRKIHIKVTKGTLNLHNPRHVKLMIAKKSEILRNRLRLISNLQKRIKNEKFTNFCSDLFEKYGIGVSEIKELLFIFGLFDRRKKGIVPLKKVKKSLESLGPDIQFHVHYQIICKWQSEGRIFLNFENFVELISQKVDTSETRENYRKIFNIMDDSSKAFITYDDVNNIVKKLALEFKEDDIRMMIKGADIKKNNQIGFEDFYRVLTKKTF